MVVVIVPVSKKITFYSLHCLTVSLFDCSTVDSATYHGRVEGHATFDEHVQPIGAEQLDAQHVPALAAVGRSGPDGRYERGGRHRWKYKVQMRNERDDGATVVVDGEAVPRWRVRRDGGGAAALARRAAAAGDVSLLRKLEPVVDLVTAVDGVAREANFRARARALGHSRNGHALRSFLMDAFRFALSETLEQFAITARCQNEGSRRGTSSRHDSHVDTKSSCEFGDATCNETI